MKKLFLSSLILIASSSVLFADSISLVATTNSPQVSLDEVLQLTLTFSGVSQDLDPISLPVVDGFTSKFEGQQNSISIINGDSHSAKSFVYDLFPTKVGHFTIPPISATVAGQTYVTKPINVEVVQNESQVSTANGGVPDQNQAPSNDSVNQRAVLIASVDKTDVYLNEKIPLTIKLLYHDINLRDVQFPPVFDKTGLVVDDYQKPEEGTQDINGVQYSGVLFKTNIYPNHLGDITLGPVQVLGNVYYKTGENNPFAQAGGFSDVFNSFFDSYAARPVTLSAQPVVLHVMPLPDTNRPTDFSGAIGQFDFQASVSPTRVKAGDPITLKMQITGDGDFKSLKIPEFNATGFKSYAPQIKNTDGAKTAEIVIIPNSADTKQVPALQFSYFDTGLKDYKTITRGPFPIQVSAPNPDQEFKAIGFSDISKEPAAPVNQFSLGQILINGGRILTKLFHQLWFWISLIFTLVAVAAYFIWKGFQEKLQNDPAFARRLKAVREARVALKPAQGYIAAGQTKEFYGLLTKVIHDYLANKWHESSAALSNEDILNHLKASNVDADHLAKVKTLLEQADLVCFAGAGRDASQMKVDLAQTQELIAYLEKQIK